MSPHYLVKYLAVGRGVHKGYKGIYTPKIAMYFCTWWKGQDSKCDNRLNIYSHCIPSKWSHGYVIGRWHLFYLTAAMKLFQTGNIDLVKCCQSFFCFELLSAIHDRRASKFDLRYRNHSNLFCLMISSLWKTFVGTIVSVFSHCRFSLCMI